MLAILIFALMQSPVSYAEKQHFADRGSFYTAYGNQIDALSAKQKGSLPERKKALVSICNFAENTEFLMEPNLPHLTSITDANFAISSAQSFFESAFGLEDKTGCALLAKRSFNASECHQYWHTFVSENKIQSASDLRDYPDFRYFSDILRYMGCQTPQDFDN